MATREEILSELQRRGIDPTTGKKSSQETQPNVQKMDRNVPESWTQKAMPYIKAGAKATTEALARPLTRPVLEMGGMAAGEALGAGPVTGNIGGGVGYAAGRQAADLLEHVQGSKEPYTLKGQAKKAALDVPAGMAMGAIGKVAEKGIAAGIEKVVDMVPRIYEKMIKMPMVMSRLARGKVTSTALKEGIPVTEGGLEKLQSATKEIQNNVNRIIDQGAKEGKSISAKKVIGYLADARKKYSNNPLSENFIKDIDELETTLKAKYIGKKDDALIPIQEAQKIKQETYKMLKSHYEKSAKGSLAPSDLKDAQVQGLEAFARGLKEQIVEQFPVLKHLNAREGAMLDLEKYLVRAVNRVHNREIGGIALDIAAPFIGGAAGGYEGRHGGAGGIGGGIAGGAAMGMGISRALKNPAFMSRLAFALRKAAKVSPVASKLGLPAGYGIGKAAPYVAEAMTPNASAEEPGRRKVPSMLPTPGTVAADTVNTATASYLSGDYKTAIEGFRKAIRLDPTRAKYYINSINDIMAEQKGLKQRGLD